jgi:biopolymer transport protein ExbD
MAGGGGALPSSSRRRSLDAEINLVPFIDLLSMCICFLLMTAVWMEIGAINIKQAVGTDGPSPATNSSELDVKFVTPQKVELVLKANKGGSSKLVVEDKDDAARGEKISEALKKLSVNLKLNPQADYKEQMGRLISSARVSTKEGVPYGVLVSTMDAIRKEGVVNLGVVPVR